MTETCGLPVSLPWSGDETLYSWCCRWHRLTLNQTRRSGMTLFGVSSAAKVSIAPNPFGRFNTATRGELGSPGLILQQRTVVGSFLALARPHQRQKILSGELCPGYLVNAKSGMALTLRYCTWCANGQREAGGIPYWRIEHQLPGVAVCLEHVKPLCELTEKRQIWALPDTGAVKELSVASPLELNGLTQAALVARHIFRSETLEVDVMIDCARKIIEEGYGVIDAKHLDPEVVDLDWRRSVIAGWCERTFPSSTAFPPMWITDLVRSRRSEVSPLRWTFLIAYMQEKSWITPEIFFVNVANESSTQMNLWGAECEIPTVILNALSESTNANQAAKLIGVHVLTVRKWVRENAALSKVIAHWMARK